MNKGENSKHYRVMFKSGSYLGIYQRLQLKYIKVNRIQNYDSTELGQERSCWEMIRNISKLFAFKIHDNYTHIF